jgi:hypothetical protein
LPVLPASAEQAPTRQVRADVVPAELFGMHLLSPWSPGTVWPIAPVGLYRMVAATPRWCHLHLEGNRWAENPEAGTGLSRIRAVLDFRDEFAPDVPAMYTLGGGGDGRVGGFPAWLATSGADTLEAWRSFVREVGTRFRGRIRYWEVWNEPDSRTFYSGTVRQLVELTRIAAQELRAIDPANVIVGPAFTESGLAMMEAFLAAGGARDLDVLAWHQDNGARPEQDTVRIQAVRRMMEAHGVGHLPLWTTEGHARMEPGGDPAAIVARTYLVLWLYGVSSFSWYAWDVVDYGPDHPGPWVTLVTLNAAIPSAAGVAYAEVARWLTGARVVDLRIEGPLWTVELARPDGGPAWIVWHTGPGSRSFAVPEPVRFMTTLDGATTPWSGGVHLATGRPVLFR